jgi:hypothetical protein
MILAATIPLAIIAALFVAGAFALSGRADDTADAGADEGAWSWRSSFSDEE